MLLVQLNEVNFIKSGQHTKWESHENWNQENCISITLFEEELRPDGGYELPIEKQGVD